MLSTLRGAGGADGCSTQCLGPCLNPTTLSPFPSLLLSVPQHPSASSGPACRLRNESERELFCQEYREYSLLQLSSVRAALLAPALPGTTQRRQFSPLSSVLLLLLPDELPDMNDMVHAINGADTQDPAFLLGKANRAEQFHLPAAQLSPA